MYRVLILYFCMTIFATVPVWAKDLLEVETKPGAKELSGMSIVGNDEAPKSLYIVPWKSSELGRETNMDMMLNEGDIPVDKDVFRRQLEFYKLSTTN